MSDAAATEAVHRVIVVRCPVEVAFRVWTERIDGWWPKGHSLSGDPATRVFLEGRAGGRLYERTSAGDEHAWGEVLVWAPPRHLAYHWYLGSSAGQPTRVDVHFSAQADGQTQVQVIHRGPELIGTLWERTSPRFASAWEHVLEAYAANYATLQEEGQA